MYKKSSKRGKKNRKKQLRTRIFLTFMLVIVIAVGIFVVYEWGERRSVKRLGKAEMPEWIDAQIIEVDGISRNGKRLNRVKDIVIHYVGNPGTTAQQNRDFYSSASSTVSSHFIVGLEGEIIQCIPLNEMSAASNWRNNDTISIEVCHPDSTGKFNSKTYKSLVKLTAWLEGLCNLKEEHVIRHYDITGKECPRYYVQHEDAWEQFKKDVENSR